MKTLLSLVSLAGVVLAAESDPAGVKPNYSTPPFIIDSHMHYSPTAAWEKSFLEIYTRRNAMACLMIKMGDFDRGIAFAKAHPDRVIPYAAIDIDSPTVTADIRKVHAMGFKGLGELFAKGRWDYNDPKYDPIWALAEELGLPVAPHTGNLSNGMMAHLRPSFLADIAATHPRLVIHAAHFGNPWYEEAAEATRRNKNLYFDLSGSSLVKKEHDPGYWAQWLWWTDAIGKAHMPANAVPAWEKILFATDEGPDALEENIRRFNKALDACQVPAETRAKCYGSTMARIHGIPPAGSPGKLIARSLNSNFPLAHDSYNGVSCASDGKIYYVLCTSVPETGAQMYAYDPATDKIARLGDLTEACGEKGAGTVCQGKSHVNFIEANGKLYFSTHLGYYANVAGREGFGPPPPGMKQYPGGHFLSYDMRSGKFEDLGIDPNGGGIISMTMDTQRGRLYGLTWPSNHFLRFDLAKRELRDIGLIPGYPSDPSIFRALCRAPTVNPEDGSVYFTTVHGRIIRYVYDRDALEVVAGEDMNKDYFGVYDPEKPGHMGYNWRQTVWYAPERMIYGVHGNSGYLFRFDPRAPRIEVLERITSLPSKRSGMYDQFSFGYLGFTLGPDGRTLYYLTGGPIYVNGKRVEGKATTAKGEAKGLENLHLVTFDIPTARYTDHGSVFFENGNVPTYVNTLAVGKDGAVYAVARPEPGNTRSDLMRIPPVIFP